MIKNGTTGWVLTVGDTVVSEVIGCFYCNLLFVLDCVVSRFFRCVFVIWRLITFLNGRRRKRTTHSEREKERARQMCCFPSRPQTLFKYLSAACAAVVVHKAAKQS